MERYDALVGACVGLDPAIEHEEDPGYRGYLTSMVSPSLEG
jgi:hypothetical protein